HGTNDVPVLCGVATGAVTEDVGAVAGNLTTSGALTIADVDQGQSSFAAQPDAASSKRYGRVHLDAARNWGYTAADSQTSIQQLGPAQSLADSSTAVASDALSLHDALPIFHGTNDVPVLGGVATGAVTEDVGVVAGNLTTGGALTIADVDQGQSSFAA